ncbi:helix-turn-helix domain-containing protein [Streptomyces sp. NPDC002476]|uniref:helix-turn-helix domain-containing protein n=1 Tax=Streptomyces sp. NPDC002476 TaxID=3364648 RepID=UPI0036B4B75F
MRSEVLRAFRFTLDPTSAQEEVLLRHVGAARGAFNHALGMKVAAHQQWRQQVQALVDTGTTEGRENPSGSWTSPRKPRPAAGHAGSARDRCFALGTANPRPPKGCPVLRQAR